MSLPYLPAGRVAANDGLTNANHEVNYWKRFKQLAVFQEPSSVSSVAFSPCKPYAVATTSSVRLSLYDTVICEPMNLFSRFKQAVHGVRFRADGQLVAIGGDEGKVRVFDVNRHSGGSKAPLRSFRVGPSAVRVVDFIAGGKKVVSMADDGMIKIWDFADPGSSPVSEFSAHTDAIHTGAASSINENIVISGGYDHMIKLWDMRDSTSRPAVSMNAEFPVENVLFLPSENLIASAAGPIVKFWELNAGGRLLSKVQAHHKTVTSLCLATNGSTLLTGAIDRRINVIRLSDFAVVHCTSAAAPILGLAISGDDQTMAVGMGNLLALHRLTKEEQLAPDTTLVSTGKHAVKLIQPRISVQEKGEEKRQQPVVAAATKQVKLYEVDRYLKSYSHATAVKTIFSRAFLYRGQKERVVGWLKELVHRRVVHSAITGQSTEVISNLLRFLQFELFRNNYFDILRHVVQAVFDVYSVENIDPKLVPLVVKLKDSVAREVNVQIQLCQSIGVLEMILQASHCSDNEIFEDDDPVFGEVEFTTVSLNEIGDE